MCLYYLNLSVNENTKLRKYLENMILSLTLVEDFIETEVTATESRVALEKSVKKWDLSFSSRAITN